DVAAAESRPKHISPSVVNSISEVSADDWDACALDATGPEKYNPFLSHGFLSSLEESSSAVKETGWMPRHIGAKDESGTVLGVVPLYLKSHSYGEFVFDHSWADAYYSYGSRYYPKYQCCVPFTPVTGPRILLRDSLYKDQVFDIVVDALRKILKAESRVSSVHITFSSENEWQNHKEKGFLRRIGMQYHWTNRNYTCFDDFLMDMKQNKRKNMRQERKKISAQNLTMKRLRGNEIKAKHWDSFYTFYRNTTDNKRRYYIWAPLGLSPKAYYPNLHFEACYYQAIEAAIELNLKTVEAGAQGEHKIQRGYMPVPTYSYHYLLDEEFNKAIEEFVVREATQVKLVMNLIHDSGPFKEGI
ncbi:hypothetical protein ACJRO7_026290, partial [Eucalyptus globulus]